MLLDESIVIEPGALIEAPDNDSVVTLSPDTFILRISFADP